MAIFNFLKRRIELAIYRCYNGIAQSIYGISEIIFSLASFTFLIAVNFWFIYFYPFFYFYTRVKKKKSYFYLFFRSWQSLFLGGIKNCYSGLLNFYNGLMELYMTITDPLLDVFLLGDIIVLFNIVKLIFDSYVLEGIDNLLHKQKLIHVDFIYHNYAGRYLNGRNYHIPPRNEYDFLFFLHDLENTNTIPGNYRNHTSDNALDQRQKLFVNKYGYLNLTTKQKRSIRKTRLLARLGKLTCSSLVGKYIFKPIASLIEDYSIAHQIHQDQKKFFNSKKSKEKFIHQCIKRWQKRKMLGVKNYPALKEIKTWLNYYWEVGY